MTPKPLTFNSIVPVGTKLRYIGMAGLLKSDIVYEVVKQEQPRREEDTRWIHINGGETGFNPRVFTLVEDAKPEELWTL